MSKLYTNTNSLNSLLEAIQNKAANTGPDTSDATATASDLLDGKTAYVKDKKITGTIKTNTASNVSVNGPEVTIPSGYYGSEVKKSVLTADLVSPNISVDSNGLITARATQDAGYVNGGTYSTSYQLSTLGSKTYTPSTVIQTISSGRYLTGAQKIKGDVNLIAENIKQGVSIFGVTGTHTGGLTDVSSFPSGNIDQNVVYRQSTTFSTPKIVMFMDKVGLRDYSDLGVIYEMEELPDNMEASSPDEGVFHLYIINGIVYLNVSWGGNNARVMTFGQFYTEYTGASTIGIQIADKGYIQDPADITELGVYVIPGGTTVNNYGVYKPNNCYSYINEKWQTYEEYINAIFSGDEIRFSISALELKSDAFSNWGNIRSVDLPRAVLVGQSAFSGCTRLQSVNIPNLQVVNTYVFSGCWQLTDVNIPIAYQLNNYAFDGCNQLQKIDTRAVSISTNPFNNCFSLKAVIIRQDAAVCSLGGTAFSTCYHFTGTSHSTYNPNGDKDGYVYVPRSRVDEYKSATNWSTYADQIRALEDYTVDGTITGELDESKI